MAYCSVNEVRVLLQQEDPFVQPTPTEVTTIIDQTTAEIDSILASKNVSLPITDTTVLKLLEKYCSYGSACTTGFTYFGNNSAVNDSQPAYYCKEYKEFIEALKKDPESIIGGLNMDNVIIGNQVIDGSFTEAEVNELNVDQEFQY